jgi:hypothetical protein
MSRYWFTPRPGYDGPPIELTCGHHSKSDRFIPKHVRLTSRTRVWRKSRTTRMVGDPSRDEVEIYAMHMAAKRAREGR